MSQKLAKLILGNIKFNPPHGGPQEHLALINGKEEDVLRNMGGSGQMTKLGVRSFENLFGLATPQQTKQYYSAPAVKSTGPSAGLGSNQGNESAFRTTSPTGQKINYGNDTKSTTWTGGGNNNDWKVGGNGNTWTGSGRQQSNSIDKMIDSVMKFADPQSSNVSGAPATWKVSSPDPQTVQKMQPAKGITIQQGVNYSPADYMAAGYGQYQQPPSMAPKQVATNDQPKETSFNDWQIGSNKDQSRIAAFNDIAPINRVSGGYGVQPFSPARNTVMASNKDQARIIPSSIPQSLINNYAAYQQPPNDTRMAAAPSFNINSDPQPIQSADNSYLTGNKASSADGISVPFTGMGSQGALKPMIADAWSRQDSLPHFQDGKSQQASYPAGYSPNGPETPSNGIDAAPAGYQIANNSPFDQAAYDEKLQQVNEANNSSLPVKLAGFAKQTPLGSLLMGGMGLIDKSTGGLYGNNFFSSGSNPNYGTDAGNQGSAPLSNDHNSGLGNELDPAISQTYASKDEFIASMKKRGMSSERIDKLWASYLKNHPTTATATASAGPIGAGYSLATSKGNYMVDSRGNYFMMGPDRSYIPVAPPQGAVA